MNKIWLIIMALPLALAIAVANFLFTQDNSITLDNAQKASRAGNHAGAERIFSQLIAKQPESVMLHRGKISAHFSIPKRTGKHSTRDDKAIADFYNKLSRSSDASESDIGHYGLGYMQVVQDNPEQALTEYLKVQNPALDYLANSIGYIYLHNKDYEKAEQYFQHAIAQQKNIAGAYGNLARAYDEQGKLVALDTLLNDPVASEYISARTKRDYYFHQGDWPHYVEELPIFPSINTAGTLGAVLILVVWMAFLLWIDVFETEHLRHILFALVLSGGISLLCQPLYDFTRIALNFTLNGQPLHDLAYCVFGIGLIEESVKFLPFLILLRFKNIINESTDYIIYASVCGLGFAFMENILYFGPSGYDSILGRSLSSTVLHMALTSFAAYGLLHNQYRARRFNIATVMFSFSAAVVVHGVYDFWLVGSGWVSELGIISTAILLYVFQRYAVVLHNALNHSEFNQGKGKTIRCLEILGVALGCIAAYQYLVIAWHYGAQNANTNIFSMLLGSLMLSYILLIQLGEIKVIKGNWVSILKPKAD